MRVFSYWQWLCAKNTIEVSFWNASSDTEDNNLNVRWKLPCHATVTVKLDSLQMRRIEMDPCLWKSQILGWDATWKCFCAIHPLRKGSVYSLQGFNCYGRQLINNTAVNVTIVIDSQRWIFTAHLFHAVKTLMSEEERRLACIELGQNWKGLVYITVGDLSKKCNIVKMYHAIISTAFVATGWIASLWVFHQ